MTKAPGVLLLLLLVFFTGNSTQAQQSGPPMLTYSELVALYEDETPSPELATKLTKLLNTPFVINSVGNVK
jgi:hypothetical protein